ncbi:Quinate permease [Colletotrichum spinosum]|uniref:Quinate permease n=1 Tax=Colletotrichum spinosum TaxID=1347390 RepID=A0A4R8QBS6_9PEZI|nr:Quinate permease [Colletotrichum spinosum]
MGGHGSGNAAYDAALRRRQALMGASGARALVKNWKVARIAAFACIGGVLYGYNQGMFSGILAMPSFDKHMDGYTRNPTQKGWLTSILELGAWLGAVLSGFIAEVCSRKYGVLIATGVFILGVIVQITSISGGHESILGGRFITGMGVGSLSMIVPLYNSECAPPEVRGALVALQQQAITFGIMISFWIDYGCNYIGGTTVETQSDAAWLVPICLQLGPAVILLVGMIWMPFSPRWLIHHGREEEARQTLAHLRDLPENHELIELEFLEIKAQSLFEKRSVAEHFPHLQQQTAWNTFKLQFVAMKALFQTRAMFKRVIVATVTMFFQQWTGINAVLYYAPQIFGQLGLSSNTTSLLATGVVGVAMMIATIPAVLWIDRLGRKPVLTVGAIGMGTCHIIIAVILAKNIDRFHEEPAAGWASICMVWLFVVHFGYSWGPCAWIIIAEVWPLSTRPYGVALGASSNWMNNFIVGQVTPDMLVGITYGTYILFGLLTFIGAAFIWFVVPETKRLSLEEMDLVFGSEGTAQADFERMEEINREIGLSTILNRTAAPTDFQHTGELDKEKLDAAIAENDGARYLEDFEVVREKLVARGRRFADLAGSHYKAYRPRGFAKGAEVRVMVDAYKHHDRPLLGAFFGDKDAVLFMQSTGSIVQAPVDAAPAGGHIALEGPPTRRRGMEYWDDDDVGVRVRRSRRFFDEEERFPASSSPPPPPRIRRRRVRSESRSRSRSRSVSSHLSEAARQRHELDELVKLRDPAERARASLERSRKALSDFHLSLCIACVPGYDLKEKKWKSFEVDRISDIEWNDKPFESLVLPDGYKDLILAFVESQVKDRDSFDDVINGKGGGLVALLACDPGVGKTLTAESVAEKIRAPLFKMELGDYTEDETPGGHRNRSRSPLNVGGRRTEDFTTAFELAARWGAVLLIDECDMYLEQRSDTSSKRNRMVSRFLKELEYYPSLLFLTTNRERALDPAVHSRIHLTINYPALDMPSRQKIWQTFLEKSGSLMSSRETRALSEIEVNGRRIRNIVKTAGIMAKRENRAIRFKDVQTVMKITEGIDIRETAV